MDVYDQILRLQLIIARLGEKELQNWWNVDIAYKLGGVDFLARLVGKEMAPLAAGEGILKAARLKEEALIAAIPGQPAWSLFCPETKLRNELDHRFRHYKRYPEDIPPEVSAILDPDKNWSVGELREQLAALTGGAAVPIEGTSFGRELRPTGADPFERLRALAARYIDLEKGRFVLLYYRSGHAA